MGQNSISAIRHVVVAATIAAATLGTAGHAHAFTQQQADDGKLKYNNHCAQCHRPNMGGAVGPALFGDAFKTKWGGKPIADLRDWIHEFMPATAPKSLTDELLDPIVSAILFKNGVKPDDTPLNKDSAKTTEFAK